MLRTTFTIGSLVCLVVLRVSPVGAAEFPGPDPGPAVAARDGKRLTLHNRVLAATWEVGDSLALVDVTDRIGRVTVRPGSGEGFCIRPNGGSPIATSQLHLASGPVVERLEPKLGAVRLADRLPGWKLAASLASPDGSVQVQWEAVLRDRSNVIRQQWIVRAEQKTLADAELTVLTLQAEGAKVYGAVDGSPVVAGNLFFACEHPMAASRVAGSRASCSVRTFRPLSAGQSCTRGCVIGVAPPGQLRRAFLYYLDQNRPRPYRPFLHYNSWYDIAWGDRKMTEEQCLAVIEIFGRELVEKREVTLDSFVFDDGWDDNATLWRFHHGFPKGFAPLRDAAGKHRSAVGVWLSPWGGYGQAQQERLKYGKSQGFETNRNGFSLAGPKYCGRFRDVCAEMVNRYGVNYFKFDGIAQGISSTGAGPEFAGDVEALLRLLDDLRRLRPDVFVNVTTGTWPSPFWLLWGDSIWRNGGDMGFFGPGSERQRWITYRDMLVYQSIVRRAPLYPLNSLMTQGIAQARLGDASKLGADLKEIQDEMRSFFASGTQLQELYVTPQMLTGPMWDALAEGANWSRKNADVLSDVHWIGGDPGKGQVYGFGAWSPRQGMLALRNPSDKPATLAIDVGEAFELPSGAARGYRLTSPWRGPVPQASLVLGAGRAHRFSLAPFELLVFDAVPVR